METKEQLRREFLEWTVKYVEAHERLVSLLPPIENIGNLEEAPSWILTEESLAEFDNDGFEKAEKDVEIALAKQHEIVGKLSKLREK